MYYRYRTYGKNLFLGPNKQNIGKIYISFCTILILSHEHEMS